MARIPEDEIERLKQEVSVERLAEARGIKLERHGADLIGLCPFHEDHEPSLVITPSKNLWHCLGACRTGGSVIDWVMRPNGVSFRHAVELLRADHPSLAAPGPVVRKATTAAVKLETPFEPDADDQERAPPGGRLLPRDAEGEPGGARVPAGPRSGSSRDGRSLPAGIREPHARLPAAGRQTGRPAQRSGAGCSGSASCAKAGTSTSTARVVIPVIDREGQVTEIYGRKITRRRCGRARRCTCTCPGRTAVCGTSRPSRQPRRSSCASRSSTRSRSGAPASRT